MNDLATLAAKDQIAACIHHLFISTDERNWTEVRECLADSVDFDMTSLTGGAPSTLSADQIVDGWRAGLAPIEHVHHQAGNLRIAVNGSAASAFCYGIALHYRNTRSGNNVRRFVGSYDFRLELLPRGWVISAFRFNVKFVDGNLDLDKAP
jgi:SnoaL-like protein